MGNGIIPITDYKFEGMEMEGAKGNLFVVGGIGFNAKDVFDWLDAHAAKYEIWATFIDAPNREMREEFNLEAVYTGRVLRYGRSTEKETSGVPFLQLGFRHYTGVADVPLVQCVCLTAIMTPN